MTGHYLTDKRPTGPIKEVESEKAFRVTIGVDKRWFATRAAADSIYQKAALARKAVVLSVFVHQKVLKSTLRTRQAVADAAKAS